MMLLDTTTLAEYLAEATPALQAQAVVDALVDPVDVKVYDGTGTLKGSGTMATPWATAAAGVITVAEITSFAVSASGTTDASWYLRFESGSRWLRGSFGLAGSWQECTWSLPTWTTGQTGTIGTGIIGVPSNAAPSLVGAPSTLNFTAGVGGTYDFSVHKTDPDSDTPLTCELIGTAYTGVTIDSAGLLTISAAATAAVRSLTIKISDPGGLSSEFVCVVTITDLIRFAPGHYIRPGLGDSLASIQTKINTYDSRVRGVIFLRYWKNVETSKGVYDWSWHDAIADACDNAGKTYAFRIQDRIFGTTTSTGAVPSYLVSEGLTYYRLLSTSASGAALWRTAAMDYNIDLYERMLDRYRGRSNFVGVAGEESIYGQIEVLNPDYTASGYIAQEIRRMQALRAYAPEIPFWLYTNWVTGDDGSMTAMLAWFAAARADLGVFVNGGPDTNRARPPAGSSTSDGEDILRGDVGGINHRGVYLMLGSTENEEFSRGATAAQIYAEAVTDRRANIMSWSTNPAEWLADAYPYIATHPTISAVPTAMAGLVDQL